MPRLDVEAKHELFIEATLRKRAEQLFIEWTERVRRKAQDELQAACVSAGDALAQMKHLAAQHRATRQDMAGLKAKLQQKQEQGKAPGAEKTIKYEGLLGRGKYFALLVFLIAVEWVVNVPIVRELLPKDAGADRRWQDVVDHADKHGSFAGLWTLKERILFSPDAALVALGAVSLLLVLCHITGRSFRKLIAFRSESPFAMPLTETHRKQAKPLFIAGIVGISAMLIFLGVARWQIAGIAQETFNYSAQHVSELVKQKSALQAQGNSDAATAMDDQISTAQSERDQQDQNLSYARRMSKINSPVSLLNLTLAIIGAAAAYMESKGQVSETTQEVPKEPNHEIKLDALRRKEEEERAAWRKLSAAFEESIAKARYLESQSPLQDWAAKAARLDGVIPLFRAENARIRGLDVQKVLAFQMYKPLALRPAQEDIAMHACMELAQWEIDYEQLTREMHAPGEAPRGTRKES